MRTKAPAEIVERVLNLVNPPVKIIDHNVIMRYYMLNKIKLKIKEEIESLKM
jgi:hypothetical protein